MGACVREGEQSRPEIENLEMWLDSCECAGGGEEEEWERSEESLKLKFVWKILNKQMPQKRDGSGVERVAS